MNTCRKLSLSTMFYWFPRALSVIPAQADTATRLTRRIRLNIPIVSAAMDTGNRISPGHRTRAAGRHRRDPSQYDD